MLNSLNFMTSLPFTEFVSGEILNCDLVNILFYILILVVVEEIVGI